MCSAPQNNHILTDLMPLSKNSATFLRTIVLGHPVYLTPISLKVQFLYRISLLNVMIWWLNLMQKLKLMQLIFYISVQSVQFVDSADWDIKWNQLNINISIKGSYLILIKSLLDKNFLDSSFFCEYSALIVFIFFCI